MTKGGGKAKKENGKKASLLSKKRQQKNACCESVQKNVKNTSSKKKRVMKAKLPVKVDPNSNEEDYFKDDTSTEQQPTSQPTKTSNSEKTTDVSTSDSATYSHDYENPEWEGNENDEGSVASGILEEDFCHFCGNSTLSSESWNNVILCDICDAEYHTSCLKLEKIPRSTFVCYKCLNETEAMKNMRFNVSDIFRVSAFVFLKVNILCHG